MAMKKAKAKTGVGTSAAKTKAARPRATAAAKPAGGTKPAPASKRAAAASRHGRRADFGASVDSFVARLPRDVRPLVEQLRSLVRAAEPRAEEAIKWGMPVYQYQGMLCAITPSRGYTRLQFYQKLEDPEGLLEGTGKSCTHVKIRKTGDIRDALFTEWIRASAQRNEKK